MNNAILATIIQQTAHTREESWEWPAYAKDVREAHNKRVEQRKQDRLKPLSGDEYLDGIRNRTSTLSMPRDHYYLLALDEAAQEACRASLGIEEAEKLAPLVANMMYTMWNDALSWAKDVLGTEAPPRSKEAEEWRETINGYYEVDSDTPIPEPT